jgi:hypothetical protein
LGSQRESRKPGGTVCDLDQLAAALSVIVSGAFRARIANAKTFGLIDSERGGPMRLTEFGRAAVDPNQEAWARAEAFLQVPLFSAIYERYKGYKLPADTGLESEISALGVSSKQTDRARQALVRSARQAGFFAHGEDRLVKPSVQGPGTRPLGADPMRKEDRQSRNGGRGGGAGGGTAGGDSTAQQDLPYFVKGLLKSLPAEDSVWESENRVKWLEAAARCFDLMYGGGDGKISIVLTKDSGLGVSS